METTSSHRDPTGPLLTTSDVAEILRVTPRTVRRLGDSGQLTRVRLGRRTVRFHPSDVAAFIERHSYRDADTSA